MMKISTCTDRSLLTPCGLDRFDYQLDPYIGCEHYCYYCYALQYAETDWRQEVQIHSDIEKRLVNELNDITPQPIYIGYHSDPYQPCEAKCKQTHLALQMLKNNDFSASFLTKSDLFLRDLDIISVMSDASVSVSVSFKDDRTRALFEANTIDTKRRIEALRATKRAGIRTRALLCPVIPYISEPLNLLDQLSDCADTIWIYGLSADKDNLSDLGWKNTRRILADRFPDIADRVERAVFSHNHPFWVQLREEIEDFNHTRKLDLRIHI